MVDLEPFKAVPMQEIVKTYGINLKDRGNCLKGNCPSDHTSESQECFTVWKSTNTCYCFNCKKVSGDTIRLVELVDECDFFSAVNKVAAIGSLSEPFNSDIACNNYRPTLRAQECFTTMTEFYQGNVDLIKDEIKHLWNLSDEIIEKQKIGYSTGDGGYQHLKDNGFTEGEIEATTLFNFGKGPNPDVYEYFKHRIILPYLKFGRPVYAIGRQTSNTPADDKYEKAKYKKLRKNEIFQEPIFNQDCVIGADDIIITEGIADAIALIQHGYHAISPVTTRFKKEHYEPLYQLVKGADRVFIANDNEDNKSGLKGALQTAEFLFDKGVDVRIVELPND